MPYRSDFFTAVETSPGVYDRTYDASRFANRFAKFFTDGVIKDDVTALTTELQVSVVTSTMKTSVNLGQAIIKGYLFDLYSSAVELTHSTANPVYNRIDRVVLELNLTEEVRAIEVKILEGTPSATPVAPSLTRTTDIYQLSLAQVLVVANTSSLSSGNVTDERNNVSVCGLSVVKTPHADEGTYAQTAGDTFTGDVTLENNVMLKGKNIAGVASNLVYVDATDVTVLGTIGRATKINSSIDPTVQVGGNTYILTHTGNANTLSVAWTGLTYQNGWVNFGSSYYNGAYCKTKDGFVILRGMIKSGTVNAVIANLPSGCRPIASQTFTTISNDTLCRIVIYSTGDIKLLTGSNIWVSLDGISFRAEA